MNNDNVIAPGMFRINPDKTSRKEKHMPNTVSASTRTKSITVSQPPVITKKDVNSDLNGLSSIRIDNTKTRRPQPRRNTKNDRVSSAFKSSRSKNKEAEVEEHHRNLLLSKNNKHISLACNNIKIDSQDVISKVVCAMCKKCLISVNHDKCLSKNVNGKNYCGKNQKAKVSVTEIQKKYQPKVTKPKKLGTRKSLATPKPRKSRLLLRWSPTGRLFNQEGKPVDSNESKTKSDCSNEIMHVLLTLWNLKSNGFQILPLCLTGYSDLFMFMGTVRFGNDHVAIILGFGDLQWGNILITRVYFVEGLGHNLFSVGQFCDLDLKVAFRRDACFVRKLEGVDLLKGDRSTNLYTINLHEMASASPISLLAQMTLSQVFQSSNTIRNIFVLPVSKEKQKSISSTKISSKFEAEITSSPYGFVWTSDNCQYKWKAVRFGDCGRLLSLHMGAEAIIHRRFNKTPYELINGRKLNISFLHAFGALCYPKNDREEIGKLGAKGYIGFFIGYSADSCAYRVYNRQTKKIMETMNVSFDELFAMAFEQRSLKPGLNSMTSRQINSGLDLTYAPSTITTQQPSEGELDLLFEAMYDDYIGGQLLATVRTVSPAQEPQVRQSSMASTTIAYTALIPTNSSSHITNIPITSQDVDELNANAMVDGNTFFNPFANPSTSAATASSSQQNSKYVLEILNKYGMESCDPIGTPMEIKDKLDLDQSGTSVDAMKYRSMIGALMYLTSSRPDIVHATCLCARYQAKPTEKHLKEVKRIFRYLQGIVNTGLWYTKDSGFELTGFSDADYVGCKDTFKSTSGGAQFFGEKLVSWSLKKQDCTALSTAKAEYVSLSACCAQVLWMRTQLTDYGFHFNKILIYCDSKSAIAISCNPVQHSRTKHIAVCYHFIKEHVKKGTIELYFVKTDYQLADIFIKAIPIDRFNYLVHRLGMRSLSPKEPEHLAKSQ
uniref:Retrovirus-related Pol polyprotein from transposon TNT 1-94 n=1 Tax=Tanacetum cinerariifolium TaxID=118510 RepID=A0A6L2M3V2_TANCI|nr:retrovirus-related Pol polyprotein from transposon TNT 1-94 [Tanacetum cinerariifolium]